MTTFLTQVLNELEVGHDGPEIPEAKRVYFQRRLRDRFFDFLRQRFEHEESKGLTQAKLARRIGKSPEVINRWLNAPSNLTLDSISDLMIGVCAEEPEFEGRTLIGRAGTNYDHLDDEEEAASAQTMKLDQDEEIASAITIDPLSPLRPRRGGHGNSSRQSAQENAYSDQHRRRAVNE